MNLFDDIGSEDLAQMRAFEAKKRVPRASKKSSVVDMHAQISIFDLLESAPSDILASGALLDAIENIVRETSDALISLPEMAGDIKDAKERDALDLARHLSSAGIDKQKIEKALKESGANVEQTIHRMDVVQGSIDIKATQNADKGRLSDKGAEKEKSVYLDGAANELENLKDANSGDTDDFDDEFEQGIDAPEKSTSARAKKSNDDFGAGADTLTLYLSSLRSSRFDPPTAEMERSLSLRIKSGDINARNDLVARNMRYAVSVARRYIKTGRPFDDLIQAASEGLMAAADRYDPELGRFTTIATFWMRQKIQRAVASDSTMPMPTYLPGRAAKLRKMAEEAGTQEEKDKLESKAVQASKRFDERRQVSVSLDALRDTSEDGEGSELLNMMAAEGRSSEDRAEQIRLVTKLHEFANAIPDERVKMVFFMRMGMHEDHLGDPQTLSEIGEAINLSRERIRQLYSAAAADVATKMERWAKGPENLPKGFRAGLMNPSKL